MGKSCLIKQIPTSGVHVVCTRLLLSQKCFLKKEHEIWGWAGYGTKLEGEGDRIHLALCGRQMQVASPPQMV